MTKKHFIALAETLAEIKRRINFASEQDGGFYKLTAVEANSIVQDELVRFCRAQNWRFKQGVFIGYSKGECGPCGGAIRKVK